MLIWLGSVGEQRVDVSRHRRNLIVGECPSVRARKRGVVGAAKRVLRGVEVAFGEVRFREREHRFAGLLHRGVELVVFRLRAASCNGTAPRRLRLSGREWRAFQRSRAPLTAGARHEHLIRRPLRQRHFHRRRHRTAERLGGVVERTNTRPRFCPALTAEPPPAFATFDSNRKSQ